MESTYARNNHAIRDEYCRCIQYEDGSEELYDHRNDDEEWYNLADNEYYTEERQRLKTCLPRINEPWAPDSRFGYNTYLSLQKTREAR
mgnify:CR=1 FL=1